eukprot:TRINITY_DN18394_c0_g1_i1.p1 TRINITY_DN18394_c0_g1~~TRINITY_DN18394_c0_g1_i1.p1  ORF type:complete len:430 (-),score=3.23 TRINITY_DN18394_c0_g1_i1:656-1945(-)
MAETAKLLQLKWRSWPVLAIISFMAFAFGCSVLLISALGIDTPVFAISGYVRDQESGVIIPGRELLRQMNLSIHSTIDALISKTQGMEAELEKSSESIDEGFKSKAMQALRACSCETDMLNLTVPDPRVRSSTDGTLCQYSLKEVTSIISQAPHQTGTTGSSLASHYYWIDESWRSFHDANEYISKQEGTLCIVVASKGALPCFEEVCFYQLYVRPRTSDMKVVRQVMERAEYDFVKEHVDVHTILDAGANIGIASILFAIYWPNAKIVGIEPSSLTYEQLQKNVGSLPNVVALNAGLWARNKKLVFGPNSVGAWGENVHEADGNSTKEQLANGITSVSVPYVMDLFSIKSVDFVKIDIEGAEGSVLVEAADNDLSWVDKAKLISVEFHRRPVYSGVIESYQYLQSLQNFTASKSGEYVVFKRKAELAG